MTLLAPVSLRLPYPGLRPFRSDEAALFFGRDDCVAQMIDRLRATRFLAVIGTSGSGKSSLVRTGLVDGLKTGLMADAEPGWQIADLQPGDDPFTKLAAALLESRREQDPGETDPIDARMLGAALRRSPNGLVKWCLDGNLPQYTNLLVIVDQFEELFRYKDTSGHEQTEAFVARLIESAHSRAAPIYVIITMRSEFLGPCALIPELAEEINAGLYLTRRMTRDETEEAIRGPEELCGFEIEPALVTRLLNDLASFAPWEGEAGIDRLQLLARRADQLPLMQHVLNRLWTKAASAAGPQDHITLKDDDYTALGGLGEALSAHADEILLAIPQPHRDCAETVFRALVDGNSIATAIRRPRKFRELVELTGGNRDGVAAVVNAYRDPDCNFLTPPLSEALENDPKIDISHESLIRQWSRLTGWMQAEAKAGRQYAELLDEARKWDARGRTQGLLDAEELREAELWWSKERPTSVWAERYGGNFELVRDLLKASAARQKEEEQRREAEVLRRQRRRRRWQFAGYGTAAAAVLLAAIIWQFGGAAARAIGNHYAKANNTEQALFWYGVASSLHDAPAELAVANAYYNGTWLPQDYAMAKRWYTLAAADGSADAEDHIGLIYANGDGVTEDYNAAMIAFLKAASGGDPDANFEVGKLYYYGRGPKQDFRQAFNWFQKAAAKGHGSAEFGLGLLYETGQGVKQNYSTAMFWYQKAAAQDNMSKAVNRIGMLYEYGEGVTQNYAQAMTWFQKAAAQGDAAAQRNIGDLYDTGEGVNQDYGQAMTWYQKAAAQGDATAEREIGDLYDSGQGVKQDYRQALLWYRKAAGQGDAQAEFDVGLYYNNGYGVAPDYAQAMTWYLQAAAQGDADAEGNIGYLYDFGYGVKQDYGQAFSWYQQAAAQGLAGAENNIGADYEEGEGVAQDYGQAMTWYQKAAAQGDATAEKNIGDLYGQGDGVKQDYVQAFNWYQKAAADGSVDAQEKIGLAYLNGTGVKQDYAKAKHWFITAGQNGSTDAEQQIGLMYLNGEGVAPNDGQALAWFEKANGDAWDAEDAIGTAFLNGTGVKPDSRLAMKWFQKAARDGSYDAADQAGYLYMGGNGIARSRTAAMAAFKRGLQIAQTTLAKHSSDAAAMGNVAWQYILNGQPQAAVDASANAFALRPDMIWLEANEAHAWMMLGQTSAARNIYLKYEDVQDDGTGDAWKTDVLNDFVTLIKLGYDYPLMQEIRNDFAMETSGTAKAVGGTHIRH